MTPAVLALPEAWQTRLAPMSMTSGVVAFFIDPNDAATAKLLRGRDNDVQWVRAGLAEGVLEAATISTRSRSVPSATVQELQALDERLQDMGGLRERSPDDADDLDYSL